MNLLAGERPIDLSNNPAAFWTDQPVNPYLTVDIAGQKSVNGRGPVGVEQRPGIRPSE